MRGRNDQNKRKRVEVATTSEPSNDGAPHLDLVREKTSDA